MTQDQGWNQGQALSTIMNSHVTNTEITIQRKKMATVALGTTGGLQLPHSML